MYLWLLKINVKYSIVVDIRKCKNDFMINYSFRFNRSKDTLFE